MTDSLIKKIWPLGVEVSWARLCYTDTSTSSDSNVLDSTERHRIRTNQNHSKSNSPHFFLVLLPRLKILQRCWSDPEAVKFWFRFGEFVKFAKILMVLVWSDIFAQKCPKLSQWEATESMVIANGLGGSAWCQKSQFQTISEISDNPYLSISDNPKQWYE